MKNYKKYNVIPDDLIIRLIKMGFKDLFVVLRWRYENEVNGFLLYRIRNKEGITNQFWEKIENRVETFNPSRGTFKKWLWACVWNFIKDHYRKYPKEDKIANLENTINEDGEVIGKAKRHTAHIEDEGDIFIYKEKVKKPVISYSRDDRVKEKIKEKEKELGRKLKRHEVKEIKNNVLDPWTDYVVKPKSSRITREWVKRH